MWGSWRGGAYAWCLESNRELSIADALDVHVFRDRARVMGRFVMDMGNVYQATGEPLPNGTRVFWAFAGNPDRKKLYEGVTREQWDATERRVNEIMGRLDGARMERGDAGVIVEEYRNSARMLVHGCQRGRWLLDKGAEDAAGMAAGMREIMGHHRRLWLARNRVGGLQDSTGRLEMRLAEYR